MKLVTTFPDFIRSCAEIEVPLPGVRGWMIQGGEQQVVFVEFDQTVEVPQHSHAAQWEFPVAGSALLRMEGETTEYQAGENFYIPPGVPHAATVNAGYRAVIIFDEPSRYHAKA
jgi:quercetin dioxygenase-like cupin family protein